MLCYITFDFVLSESPALNHIKLYYDIIDVGVMHIIHNSVRLVYGAHYRISIVL